VGVFKELLEKGCEPRTCMQIVVDWCPECKASFAKIIDTLRGVVPAGYRRLWDSRLMARYWAIKSQLRCSWAVDAETVGYQAFSSRDEIEYVPSDKFDVDGERQDGYWELQALDNEVHRLQPDFVWIKDGPCGRRSKLHDQLYLCERALELTEEKARNHGRAVQKKKNNRKKFKNPKPTTKTEEDETSI
jgi:hypothetical protein